MKIHNISEKTPEHLQGRLAGDSPVHKITPGKVFVQTPGVRDGVSQKNHPGSFGHRRQEFGIRVSVALVGVGIGGLRGSSGCRRDHQGVKMALETVGPFTEFIQLSCGDLGERRGARKGLRDGQEGFQMVEELVSDRDTAVRPPERVT